MMKKILLSSLAILAAALLLCGTTAAAEPGRVEISFTFQQLAGFASNQYAVWIEDDAGEYVRTVFATRFTADGGWKTRPLALAHWVEKSSLPEMSSGAVDAFSGPTPRPGEQTYVWDCKDNAGTTVPAGKYVVCVEGTLRNEDVVIYTAAVEVGGPSKEAEVRTEYFGSETDDRRMLGGVRVNYVAP
jgi:hypothetical protein